MQASVCWEARRARYRVGLLGRGGDGAQLLQQALPRLLVGLEVDARAQHMMGGARLLVAALLADDLDEGGQDALLGGNEVSVGVGLRALPPVGALVPRDDGTNFLAVRGRTVRCRGVRLFLSCCHLRHDVL